VTGWRWHAPEAVTLPVERRASTLSPVRIRHSQRDAREALKTRGIGTLIHYPTPVHCQPTTPTWAIAGSLPMTEQIAAKLSLPGTSA
jgi:hypothetical protein